MIGHDDKAEAATIKNQIAPPRSELYNHTNSNANFQSLQFTSPHYFPEPNKPAKKLPRLFSFSGAEEAAPPPPAADGCDAAAAAAAADDDDNDDNCCCCKLACILFADDKCADACDDMAERLGFRAALEDETGGESWKKGTGGGEDGILTEELAKGHYDEFMARSELHDTNNTTQQNPSHTIKFRDYSHPLSQHHDQHVTLQMIFAR